MKSIATARWVETIVERKNRNRCFLDVPDEARELCPRRGRNHWVWSQAAPRLLVGLAAESPASVSVLSRSHHNPSKLVNRCAYTVSTLASLGVFFFLRRRAFAPNSFAGKGKALASDTNNEAA